jgi:hypothetical protein
MFPPHFTVINMSKGTPTIDRLLNRILELPAFMSVGLTELRESYLLLLGPRSSATQNEIEKYLLGELEKLKKRALIQEYENLPNNEARFLVDERFYHSEIVSVEGPFEKRIRVNLDEHDIKTMRDRENDLKTKLAGKKGEIDECLLLTKEFPNLTVPLGEKHQELLSESCELTGRIQLIKETIRNFTKSSFAD